MKTTKQSCSKELFGFDWTAFFNQNNLTVDVDTITSSKWILSGGVAGPEFINDTETSMFIDGGEQGTILSAENTIEINGGVYVDCRTIYIEIT